MSMIIEEKIDFNVIITFAEYSKYDKVELYYSKDDQRLCLDISKRKFLLMTDDECTKLNDRVTSLEKEIENLKQMIMYMPPSGGGSGYQETKEDFQSLIRKN